VTLVWGSSRYFVAVESGKGFIHQPYSLSALPLTASRDENRKRRIFNTESTRLMIGF
jgi:hypothetical protein